MKCSVIDCKGKARRRTYCDKHYERWRVHGDASIIKNREPTLDSTREKFNLKIIFVENSKCILWGGAISRSGYGVFNYFGKTIGAHRAAYLLFIGDIQEKLMVCHKCDNRRCVNVSHLFLGDHQENMDDMKNKKRHSYGIKNNKNKLNESQVIEIKYRLLNGEIPFRLSKEFNVSAALMCDIKNGKLWKHI